MYTSVWLQVKSFAGSVLLMEGRDRDRQGYDNPVNFRKINVVCVLRETSSLFLLLSFSLSLSLFLSLSLSLSLSTPHPFTIPPFTTLYAWNEKPGRCRHIFAYKTAINDNGNCFLGKAITHNRYKPGLISPFGVSIKNMQNQGVRDCTLAFRCIFVYSTRSHGRNRDSLTRD